MHLFRKKYLLRSWHLLGYPCRLGQHLIPNILQFILIFFPFISLRFSARARSPLTTTSCANYCRPVLPRYGHKLFQIVSKSQYIYKERHGEYFFQLYVQKIKLCARENLKIVETCSMVNNPNMSN